MVEVAQRLEGTCTGEQYVCRRLDLADVHSGVGLGKIVRRCSWIALISRQKYLEAELGAGTVGLLAQIKNLVGASRPIASAADRLDPARIVRLAHFARPESRR